MGEYTNWLRLGPVCRAIFDNLSRLSTTVLAGIYSIRYGGQAIIIGNGIPYDIAVELVIRKRLNFLSGVTTMNGLAKFYMSLEVNEASGHGFFAVMVMSDRFDTTRIFTELVVKFRGLSITLLGFIQYVSNHGYAFYYIGNGYPLDLAVSLVVRQRHHLSCTVNSMEGVYKFNVTAIVNESGDNCFNA